MCDVAARCPKCRRDLAPYLTFTGVAFDVDDTTTVNARPQRKYECACGVIVTVTEPTPGLVVTRQDAEVQP